MAQNSVTSPGLLEVGRDKLRESLQDDGGKLYRIFSGGWCYLDGAEGRRFER